MSRGTKIILWAMPVLVWVMWVMLQGTVLRCRAQEKPREYSLIYTNIWFYDTNRVKWYENPDTNEIRLVIRNIIPAWSMDYSGTNLIVFIENGWRPVITKSNRQWAVVFERDHE